MQWRGCLLFCLLLSFSAGALENRVLYVNGFDDVMADTTAQDALLNFAEAQGFRYLAVYGLVDFVNTADARAELAAFIRAASAEHQLEIFAPVARLEHADALLAYNNGVSQREEQISGFVTEFEYWLTEHHPRDAGDIAEDKTLDARNSSGLTYAELLGYLRAAADNNALADGKHPLVATYVGWPGRVREVDESDSLPAATREFLRIERHADEIWLATYITDPSEQRVWSFASWRWEAVAKAAQTLVDDGDKAADFRMPVRVIMSAEWRPKENEWAPGDTPDNAAGDMFFMGPYLNQHGLAVAEAEFATGYAAAPAWRERLELRGYSYFAYTHLANVGDFRFDSAGASLAEDGNAVEVAIVRHYGSRGAVDVSLDVSGSAEQGEDFDLPMQVSFASGEVRKTVNLTPLEDTLDEANETLTVTLNPAASAGVLEPHVLSFTLTDNDEPASTPTPAPTTSVNDGYGGGAILALPLIMLGWRCRRRN